MVRVASLAIVVLCAWVTWGATAAAAPAVPGDPIRVLIVGGQNNHRWHLSTPYMHYLLDRQPHIEATIGNTPGKGSPGGAWAGWEPQFSRYDCVVLDYNGKMWPVARRTEFVDYVRGGGGAVVIHAANNSFRGWPEYEDMVGLLWRPPASGGSLYVDEAGNVVREEPGQGRGMGHGSLYEWTMTTRDTTHPITQGMPATWRHCRDELYHGQRGPARDVRILLTAYSEPGQRGTGKHEPIVWWVPYGEGKVVTNLMGHVGDLVPMQCVGFQTLLVRACEWSATGVCSGGLPESFPTAQETSMEELTPEVRQAVARSAIGRVSVPVRPAEVDAASFKQGLVRELYQGDWRRLPVFTELTPTETDVVPGIGLEPLSARDRFALRFRGYLRIDTPGDYAFFTASDDGSALLLAGVPVVDNDGVHPVREAGALVTLAVGLYAIEIRYFERGGGEHLTVSYSGPGFSRRALPPQVLLHKPDTDR